MMLSTQMEVPKRNERERTSESNANRFAEDSTFYKAKTPMHGTNLHVIHADTATFWQNKLILILPCFIQHIFGNVLHNLSMKNKSESYCR